jgi:periplasmic protein TonB
MRPFFYTSFLFHGALLFLLFSWGIPLADKFSPKNIIEVSLIPGETEKEKEKEPQPVMEKKGTRKPELKEETARITKEEEPKKEEEPLKAEGKDVVQEAQRPKEEEALPQRTKPEEGLQNKTVSREEPPMSFSPQPKGDGVSSTGGPGRPEASLVAALRTGTDAGGTPLGIKGQEPGPGRAKGHTQTSRVYGDLQGGDETLRLILRKIEAAKKYPRKAQKMGIEGKALVRFKMLPDGCIETVELLESSGSEILDRASLETVRNAAPLPYKEGWLKVGIVFKIL